MKKLILSAAMLAFGSFTAFGQCMPTLLSAAGPCTITNGGFTWQLSNFGMNPGNSQNYTVFPPATNANPTASDVTLTFGTITGNGTLGANGALGFFVTFSDAPGGNNFFNAITGQSANWESFFTANHTVGGAAATIKEIYLGVNNANATGNGGSLIAKNINIVSGVPIDPDLTVQIITAAFGQSANPAQILVPGNTGQIGVVDVYQIGSSNQGGGGTASVGSYTNYFFAAAPQQAVPEPMSFVLMGAGLVGIAALRRRNG
jgi:hypothetical protein